MWWLRVGKKIFWAGFRGPRPRRSRRDFAHCFLPIVRELGRVGIGSMCFDAVPSGGIILFLEGFRGPRARRSRRVFARCFLFPSSVNSVAWVVVRCAPMLPSVRDRHMSGKMVVRIGRLRALGIELSSRTPLHSLSMRQS